MSRERKKTYRKVKENVDLHDIHELIEMGLEKEEISRELGISQKYIKKMVNDYYKDY